MIDQLYKDIVFKVAEFSTCCKKKVGAIIIDNIGEIVASGYNKSIGDNCTHYFRRVWDKVERHKLLMGSAEGKKVFPLSFEEWCYNDPTFREEHRTWSAKNEIHAEVHTLNIFKPRHKKYRMLITLEPCAECAKAIIMNGHIKEVYYIQEFKKNSGIDLLKRHFLTVEKLGDKHE